MAFPTIPITLTNGTANDATQVMADLNALLNGYTDGTTDINCNAMTAAATATVGNLKVSGQILGDVTVQTHGGTGVMLEGDNGTIDRVRSVAGNLYLDSNNAFGGELQVNSNGNIVITNTAGGSVEFYSSAYGDITGQCTFTGWVGTAGSAVYGKKVGKTCHLWFFVFGTSNANNAVITPPVGWPPVTPAVAFNIPVAVKDNGGTFGMGNCFFSAGNLNFAKDLSGNIFTNSGIKAVQGYICYQSTT